MSVACPLPVLCLVVLWSGRLASDGESGESQSGRTPRILFYSRSPERVEKATKQNQRKTPQNKYVEQKQTPKINPVHLTSVQTTIKEQDQKMPRKSRKVKSEGVADPLAKQDEDQAALDAGEVSFRCGVF